MRVSEARLAWREGRGAHKDLFRVERLECRGVIFLYSDEECHEEEWRAGEDVVQDDAVSHQESARVIRV